MEDKFILWKCKECESVEMSDLETSDIMCIYCKSDMYIDDVMEYDIEELLDVFNS